MPNPKLLVVNRSGTPQDELSRAVVEEVSWELNGYGGLTFSMQQNDPKVTKPLLLRNEVQLWIDDQLEWWGVPLKCRSNARTATFECSGLLWYFTKRFITNATQLFTSVEQFQIAYGLVTYAQSAADQNLNIANASVPASGVVRSREYRRDEHANILDLLAEFPTLARADTGAPDGFDFDIVADGTGARVFTPYYPRKGVARSNLVIEAGRNLADFEVEEDATGVATRAYFTGSNNGEVKFENNYRDAASSALYGEMQHIASDGAEKDVNVLKQKAAGYVGAHKAPAVNPTLEAAYLPAKLLGVVRTGDSIPVRIAVGRVQVAELRRVGRITWVPRSGRLRLEWAEAAE